MAFAKKTWKDRITEFPTRRTLAKSDGSTELVTVARAEGTVSQEGDSFSAENMNNLETRIGNEFGEINKSLADGQISFSVVDGEPYVKVGADTPRPFKSGASPFVTFRPERNVDGWWINQIVLFDGTNADIYLDKVSSSMTKTNANFELVLANQREGTLKFLDAGKYYINSQGITTDLTTVNEKKKVDIDSNTTIKLNVNFSEGYLVVVKVE